MKVTTNSFHSFLLGSSSTLTTIESSIKVQVKKSLLTLLSHTQLHQTHSIALWLSTLVVVAETNLFVVRAMNNNAQISVNFNVLNGA